MARNYREAYGIYAVNGILFNHESPRRGKTFVTRKITNAVARIKAGLQQDLYLGTLTARRDWGYAPEYVVAMWETLQQDDPTDYVVGTGTDHSVEDFLRFAFEHADLDWREYVKRDERYVRPTEVDSLVGDARKAFETLGWRATVHPAALAAIMVDHDLAEIEAGKHVVDVPRLEPWTSWSAATAAPAPVDARTRSASSAAARP
jgi:GDPmannose 4,6-dehydratase